MSKCLELHQDAEAHTAARTVTPVPVHCREPPVAAAAHDFEAFARAELAHRRALLYPPFTRLARCVVAGKDRAKAWDSFSAAQTASRTLIVAEAGCCTVPEPTGRRPTN